MASDASYVEYIFEQAGLGARLTSKKMFGEYALYVEGKVVAFVCDNYLYAKPTEAGRALLQVLDEQPAYPGSKLYYRIGAELDDRELLKRILLATADALPPPKPRPAKRAAGKRISMTRRPNP
jgi:TfoX/Sxy family transcriptional regulator of competence genes